MRSLDSQHVFPKFAFVLFRTGPLENSDFVFRESQCFLRENKIHCSPARGQSLSVKCLLRGTCLKWLHARDQTYPKGLMRT